MTFTLEFIGSSDERSKFFITDTEREILFTGSLNRLFIFGKVSKT